MHKTRADLIVITGAFLLVLLGILWVSVAYCTETSVTILRVVDGDTVKAMVDGHAVTLRLWGVDAPERRQASGSDATKRLAFWMTYCPCTITEHGSGRYGRSAAQLHTATGRDIGEQLIREGVAWWAQRYAPKVVAYALAEVEARAHQRGLWQDGNAVPPWVWRRIP